MADVMRRVCKGYNSRRPEVVVIAYEPDPRAMAGRLSRGDSSSPPPPPGGRQQGGRGRGPGRGRGRAPPSRAAPAEMLQKRREMNPRENLGGEMGGGGSPRGSPRSSKDDDLAFD